jgi:ParB family chromosome partitioning protein
MAVPPQKKRLGRGMSTLFGPGAGERPAAPPTPPPAPSAGSARAAVLQVAIEDIEANRKQPRKRFVDSSLNELAESIRQHGLMQPIVVRRLGGGYEIVAGERRWRAAQLAGLKQVEVVVKELAEQDVFLWALIENIQREDLNPIEEAEAYKQIIDDRSLTQEQVAEMVGKDRSSVANALRLLRLPDRVRKMVADGALSMGHARALLSLGDPDEMTKVAQAIVARGLSVRQVEKLVKARREAQAASGAGNKDPFVGLPGGAPAVERETEALMRVYGTRVRFAVNGKKGKIEIDFSSVEELDRLLDLLKR